MSKTTEEIEKEAEAFALEILPEKQGDGELHPVSSKTYRQLIKLGYMRAYNVMQSDTPLVSLSKRD